MGLQTDKFPFLPPDPPPPPPPPPPPAPLLCKRPSGIESLSSPGSRNIRHLVGVDVEIRWGGGGPDPPLKGVAVVTSSSLSNL